MAIFPKIDRPCPYKGDLRAIMDGDVCRLCNRAVFDLTEMTDEARVAFMRGCTGEVCVSYRATFRPALAAAALAVAAIGAPAMAVACEDATDDIVITMGGINDPANAKYVSDQTNAAQTVPDLPVIYEPATSDHPAGDEFTKSDAAKPAAVTSQQKF